MHDELSPAFIEVFMRTTLILAILGLALVFMAGCSKKQTPSAPSARVSATAVYEKYFGPAPTSDKGTCFAFVIFFPSAKAAGKVVPFPFFTFDEASLKKVAVERLLGGMDIGSYKGEFLQPFPVGAHVVGVSQENATVTVNFSKEILNAAANATAGKAVMNALALTLSQFSGVKDVRLQVEGKDEENILGYTNPRKQPMVADVAAVEQPSPPRLLSITAVKDKGATNIEEVSAYFDRPVDIRELKLSFKGGKPLAGDLFHSVFDMAGVLKPRDTSQFKENMPIKVRWQVVDKLGRQAEGDSVWPLEVKEH